MSLKLANNTNFDDRSSWKSDAIITAMIFSFSIILYYLKYSRFFESPDLLGHDYSYFFPNLLAGYYWFISEGMLQTPAFLPHICGGIPYYANPQSMYHSIPQILMFLTDPLTSIRFTWIFFAIIGYLGVFSLIRFRMGSSIWAANLCAVIFLFNTFYATRMVVGHLAFHVFMLVPVIAFTLLQPTTFLSSSARITRVLLGAVLISYFIHAGGAAVVLPSMVSLLFIWAIWTRRKDLDSLLNLIFASLVALFLSASKLTASIHLLKQFPRDFYPIPGAQDVYQTVLIALSGLFYPSEADRNGVIVNRAFNLDSHEFDYGLGLAPLIIIFIALVLKLRTGMPPHLKLTLTSITKAMLITMLLILPIALNVYSEQWADNIKSLPVVGSSTSLFRWFLIYIPVLIILTARALDQIESVHLKTASTFLGLIVVWSAGVVSERSYDKLLGYDGTKITTAWDVAKNSKEIVPIQQISLDLYEGHRTPVVGSGNVMAEGISPLVCYEPIFGYRLEGFPHSQVEPGPVLSSDTEFLNFHNPACMLFPEENQCVAGDRFQESQIGNLINLSQYRAFDYNQPLDQVIANWLTRISWIGILLILLRNLGSSRSKRTLPK